MCDGDDEFLINSDEEFENFEISKEICEKNNINYEIVNKIYNVHLNKSFDIDNYALVNKNIVFTTPWILTQYYRDFTINIFKSKKILVMTKIINEDLVKKFIEENLNRKVEKISVSNITILINLKKNLNLEYIYDNLIKNLNAVINLNLQKFPAIIIRFKNKNNLILEIYGTGKLNVTGLKNNSEISDVVNFIKSDLLNLIKK